MLIWFEPMSMAGIVGRLNRLSTLEGPNRFADEWYESNSTEFKHDAATVQYMGLRVTADQLLRFSLILRDKPSANEVGIGAAHVASVLESEVSTHKWMTVDANSQPYLLPDLPEIFGSDVMGKIPSCSYDMTEACKCLALGRYTASVNHLMKVVERSLRLFSRKCGVSPFKTGGTPKAWTPLVEEIRVKVRAMPISSIKQRQKQDNRLLALDRFENIRAIRNQSSHADQKYSEEEALDFMQQAPLFLKQVAKSL